MKKLLGVGLLFAAIAGGTATYLAIKSKKEKNTLSEENQTEVLEEEIENTCDLEEKTTSDEFDKLCEETEENLDK